MSSEKLEEVVKALHHFYGGYVYYVLGIRDSKESVRRSRFLDSITITDSDVNNELARVSLVERDRVELILCSNGVVFCNNQYKVRSKRDLSIAELSRNLLYGLCAVYDDILSVELKRNERGYFNILVKHEEYSEGGVVDYKTGKIVGR